MPIHSHSPSNAIIQEVKDRVEELLDGTPNWALFPRWYVNRPVFMVESSSGSILATVDTHANTVKMSPRLRRTGTFAFRKVDA